MLSDRLTISLNLNNGGFHLPEYYEKVGEEYRLVSHKLVPESDLIQAKKSLEDKVTQTEARLSDAITAKEQNLTRAITAEGEITTLKGELEPLKTAATELETTKEQLRLATESGEQAKTALLTHRRQAVAQKYGIDATSDRGKALESMTADELDNIEKSATFLGWQGKSSSSSGFDRGGGGGDNSTLTSRQKIELGLNQMREGAKQGA